MATPTEKLPETVRTGAPTTIERVMALHLEGRSNAEIAEALGLKVTSVVSALVKGKARGLMPVERGRGVPKPGAFRLIVTWAGSGVPLEDRTYREAEQFIAAVRRNVLEAQEGGYPVGLQVVIGNISQQATGEVRVRRGPGRPKRVKA